MKCIFSVDVEDWFHILDLPTTPRPSEWDALPSLVERNFSKLLDIFSEKKICVTCFFLGWVAQRFPDLVREANRRGHEIASHGYHHELVYRMSPAEFFRDAVRSKGVIEDIVGHPISGYRSSGFSVTERTPWFFEKVIQAGYRYDSSVFPARRGHGGMKTGHYAPYLVTGEAEGLIEFPISVKEVWGMPICFFGGGYLRLFPYFLIKRMTSKVLREGRPAIFYVHPRETDPDHPRLPMNIARSFRSYVNLESTENKIRSLTSEFQFTTFEKFIEENGNSFQGQEPDVV